MGKDEKNITWAWAGELRSPDHAHEAHAYFPLGRSPQWVSLAGERGNQVPSRSPFWWGLLFFRQSRKNNKPHAKAVARGSMRFFAQRKQHQYR